LSQGDNASSLRNTLTSSRPSATSRVDRYCAALLPELGIAREWATERRDPTPPELREQVEGLRDLEPELRVWSDYSGRA
jgi:hypothetical protein